MKKILLVLAVVVLLSPGCKKDEPAGNANISSIDIKVDYDDWKHFTGEKYSGWEVEKYLPQITNDLILNGAIMVYEKYEDIYIAVPNTRAFEDVTMLHYFSFTSEKLYLGFQYNWEIIYNGEPPTVEYRIVFFDKITSSEPDHNDYEKVKEYYNLVD